jgi:hypothetical protein
MEGSPAALAARSARLNLTKSRHFEGCAISSSNPFRRAITPAQMCEHRIWHVAASAVSNG